MSVDKCMPWPACSMLHNLDDSRTGLLPLALQAKPAWDNTPGKGQAGLQKQTHEDEEFHHLSSCHPPSPPSPLPFLLLKHPSCIPDCVLIPQPLQSPSPYLTHPHPLP